MKIGLCLSGGGIKGAAHIGAIKALEEENIKFDYISGTSSGSIIAALYTSGFTTDEIYKIFLEYAKKIKYIDLKNVKKLMKNCFINWKFQIDGLNSGDKLSKLINKQCKIKKIENISDIKMPLMIPAVDIRTEKLIVFCSPSVKKNFMREIIYESNINIGKAVQASCSYPGVFSPVKYKNFFLIDGGIQENIPWQELKNAGADKVISIVFKNTMSKACCSNLIQVLDKSFQIMCHELAKHESMGSDYLLEIKHENVSLLDWKKIDKLYEIGYIQTKEKIDEIKKCLQNK